MQDPFATQLVFVLLGMFSFLYQPKLYHRPNLLEISFDHINFDKPSVSTATWQCLEKPFKQSKLPVVDLLRQYGGRKGPLPNYTITLPPSDSILDQRSIWPSILGITLSEK